MAASRLYHQQPCPVLAAWLIMLRCCLACCRRTLPARAPRRSLPCLRYGSKAWQLLPELHRQPRDHVITSKHTYDAFQVQSSAAGL